MEEPIDGFWQERGRIMIDIIPAMDNYILAKLKLQQYRQKGHKVPAVINALEETIELHEQEVVRIMNGGYTISES